MTDADRLAAIIEKVRAWRVLSLYRGAEWDVAWLLDHLAERDARIAALEARVRRDEWVLRLL